LGGAEAYAAPLDGSYRADMEFQFTQSEADKNVLARNPSPRHPQQCEVNDQPLLRLVLLLDGLCDCFSSLAARARWRGGEAKAR
jgi:hypothetical protein